MLKVLRSIIDFGDPNVKNEELRKNYLLLYETSLKNKFDNPQEKEIFDFIHEFYFGEFESENDLPTIGTLKDHYSKLDRSDILEKLEQISEVSPYYGANYENLLQELVKDYESKAFTSLLQKANEINRSGLEIEKGKKILGAKEAAKFLIDNAGNFITNDKGQESKLDLRSDLAADKFLENYTAIKNDPSLAYGVMSGLLNIDQTCKGLRKGEMLLVAGFSGNMKTTLCLNWAYNAAFYCRYNVYYFTLEMSKEQVQRILYCIHAEHPQFKENPRYKEYYRPLEYNRIRDGELSPDEEEFLKIIINDIKTNDFYGNFILEKPAEEIRVADIQARSEKMNKDLEGGLDLLIVDEARLVSSKKSRGNTTEDWNEVLKDLKQLALRFNGGEGIPIISPFQTSRSGYREAEKNGGEYKQDCLSYANEAERSSDVVIFTYLDPDLRDSQEIKIGNLKNRDNPLFRSFNARVVGSSRRIDNLLEED